MEVNYIANLLNNISLTLIAISPTIFVFSVTLLGDAIEKSQQEERVARENDKENLKKEIDEIEASLKQARKNGDTKSLTEKLETLKKKQIESESKVNEIKDKYSCIDLNNSVLYPCAALLVVFFSTYLVIIFINQLKYSLAIVFFAFLLIIYSLVKIYRSLALVQQISASKKESDTYSKIKETIKLALHEHEQNKNEETEVKFIDKSFPLSVTPSTELEIKFKGS